MSTQNTKKFWTFGCDPVELLQGMIMLTEQMTVSPQLQPIIRDLIRCYKVSSRPGQLE